MSESPDIHPALKEAIKTRCDTSGYASFYDFMNIALYHPEGGYYTKTKKRVGKTPEADFYTASSLSIIFGKLVLEVAATRMGPMLPIDTVFVELGAEPEQNLFAGAASPFKKHTTLRLGDSFARIPTPSVLFANEILDAQPFHRFRFRAGCWHELGIQLTGNTIKEALLPSPTKEGASLIQRLPATTTEGYTVDIPSGAEELLSRLITPEWEGLLLFFDYGKSTAALLNETPQGSARAYARHRQSNDLLATPGEQDITCHIGWDWIQTHLEQLDFKDIRIESQEACFIKHAPQFIGHIIRDKPGMLTPERRSLQELIHPSHFGQKFQVLSATRKNQ